MNDYKYNKAVSGVSEVIYCVKKSAANPNQTKANQWCVQEPAMDWQSRETRTDQPGAPRFTNQASRPWASQICFSPTCHTEEIFDSMQLFAPDLCWLASQLHPLGITTCWSVYLRFKNTHTVRGWGPLKRHWTNLIIYILQPRRSRVCYCLSSHRLSFHSCPAAGKQDTGTSWVLRKCSVCSWAKHKPTAHERTRGLKLFVFLFA